MYNPNPKPTFFWGVKRLFTDRNKHFHLYDMWFPDLTRCGTCSSRSCWP